MTRDNERIAALNDTFRRTFAGGRIVMTAGVASLPESEREQIIGAVREFETFDADNDPYGEHDFGAFDIAGQELFWKIDYYDAAMKFGSEDPTDPAKTTRVLTIMLAEEY
jgi:hypothetical protein